VALTVVATPIGNLGDLSPRAADALRAAEVIACEDTRRTRALLAAQGIPTPQLVLCDERSEERHAAGLARQAAEGRAVVLVTDAGMPAIADPGRAVVAAAVEAGAEVVVVPGPSAVETALVASGLAADRYAFWGWVPRRVAERERFLRDSAGAGLPVVAFESPRRLRATLEALEALDPQRRIAVARELTKLHEQVARGVPGEVLAALPDPVLGEVALVLAPVDQPAAQERLGDALAAARELVAAGIAPSRAAALCAGLAGVRRRALYEALLRTVDSSARQVEQTGRP
jgi:16S rRNA (cytidine1402-2'-O)-methyltransferase